ncbi:MAG: bifunctional glutamate N-acetyltransferase/amino-acid acetyltransferase ArgJ [Nitrospirae bacterium]|nr:bifunctional glutamate N-acetyltransferase/amino-acid acetyltransferase ArgJ [Nitrospirota bacterium]
MCPIGFKLSIVEAGIKKSDRPDMALIYSEKEAVSSAMFTTNRIKGAPVKLNIHRIKSGRGRAILINSGNSNVMTGKKGIRDAIEMARLTARELRIPEELVYVCSTGVIGVLLPMEKIRQKIPFLTKSLGGFTPFDTARAIMTTDTFPKVSERIVRVGKTTGRILGIAKGAGMIAPHMATMMAFFMTDIAIERNAMRKAFREAVNCSFNRITVDGDMSTSDSAFIMANGMLGNKTIKEGSTYYRGFRKALNDLAYELSRMIVRDGEGATKLIEIEIRGAKTDKDALRAAFAIANSNLVKTAIYGEDVNWGRIMAALGRSGASLKEEKTDIYFGDVKIVGRGVFTGRAEEAKKVLEGSEIKLTVNLNSGISKANVLTCDLTEEYVKVNAEYTT